MYVNILLFKSLCLFYERIIVRKLCTVGGDDDNDNKRKWSARAGRKRNAP